MGARASVLIFCAFLVALGGCAPVQRVEDPSLAERYRATKAALVPSFDGFLLQGGPELSVALERYWTLLGDWTAAYANDQPLISAERIERGMTELDDTLAVHVLPLDGSAFMVAAAWNQLGTVFILAPSSQHYAVAWTIRSAAVERGEPSLRGWSPDAAREACWLESAEEPFESCGPFLPRPEMLPPDAIGAPRFYLDAARSYPGMPFHARLPGQVSVWTWRGDTAVPLLIKNIERMINEQGARFDGAALILTNLVYFRSFYDCGSCEGRRLEERIRVTPDGLQSLGPVSLVPELDFLDEVYATLLHGGRVSHLASPHAVNELRLTLKRAAQECPQPDGEEKSLGMLWRPSIGVMQTSPNRRVLTFATDCLLGLYHFTLDVSGPQLKLVRVRWNPN